MRLYQETFFHLLNQQMISNIQVGSNEKNLSINFEIEFIHFHVN